MKLLILCLFFGIIFANTEESFEKLVQMIEGLKKEVDHLKQNNKKMGRFTELKDEIKNLKISMSDQELRIQVNEEDLKAVDDVVDNLKTNVKDQEARIQANGEDLKGVEDLVKNQEAMIHANGENFKGVDNLVNNQEARIQANKEDLEVSICYLNHTRKN